MTGSSSDALESETEPVEPNVGYRVRLLGVPVIERRSETGFEELSWSLRRALKILGFLASSQDLRAPREEIIDAIWPEASRGVIERNFHPTISLLRRGLEPSARSRGSVIRQQHGVYALDSRCDWQIDILTFEELFEAGRRLLDEGRRQQAARRWEGAWKLYRGIFFRGHDDPWILTRRERFQRMYVELLSDLGDVLLEIGSLTRAEDAYRSLLLEDPLQESVYVALMRVYSKRSRRDLVQRQYEHMCRILRQELGVEPSAATLEAYNILLL